MTVEAPVATDDPLMIAWEAYKATPEFANTYKWALSPQRAEDVMGSLWAAFSTGFAGSARVVLDPKSEAAIWEKARQAYEDDRVRLQAKVNALEERLSDITPQEHFPRVEPTTDGSGDIVVRLENGDAALFHPAGEIALEIVAGITSQVKMPHEMSPEAACNFIRAVLKTYRLTYTRMGEPHEEEGVPLVDALTSPGDETIASGEQELELLTEHLYDNLPPFRPEYARPGIAPKKQMPTHRLVPRVPTAAMVDALNDALNDCDDSRQALILAIDAAPVEAS